MDCAIIEPCHNNECDGLDEVVRLLPNGRIWNPDRGGVYSGYIHALGHIKTELNKRICQEFDEVNPCTSKRLFSYWAKVYSLPPCVPQTQTKMCEWIALLNGPCPIGSLGFYKAAIEFVAPGKGIEIAVNVPDIGANCWCPPKPCADANPIVITAPPATYYYEEVEGDEPYEWQDGENCRIYFIPEIECLKRCVFPFGLGVGYKTNPLGLNGADIGGVPIGNVAKMSQTYFACETSECPDDTAPIPVGPFTNTGLQGTTIMPITRGTFSGTAPISLSASGLPSGVTFTNNGNGSYTLTGIWPAAGSYAYAVTATNSAGSTTVPGNMLISTAGAVPPIAPSGAPFSDSGVAGTAI